MRAGWILAMPAFFTIPILRMGFTTQIESPRNANALAFAIVGSLLITLPRFPRAYLLLTTAVALAALCVFRDAAALHPSASILAVLALCISTIAYPVTTRFLRRQASEGLAATPLTALPKAATQPNAATGSDLQSFPPENSISDIVIRWSIRWSPFLLALAATLFASIFVFGAFTTKSSIEAVIPVIGALFFLILAVALFDFAIFFSVGTPSETLPSERLRIWQLPNFIRMRRHGYRIIFRRTNSFLP